MISSYVETPPADPDAPGAFRFAESGKLARIVSDAGAIDVGERVFTFHIKAPISPAEFWAMRCETSDTLREKLAKLTTEHVVRVAQEVQEKVREFFPNDQMNFPAQMIVVTGRKPQ